MITWNKKNKKLKISLVKLIFICICMVLLPFSCRTTKQTSTLKAEVKTAANLTTKQSADANLNITSGTETKSNQSRTVKSTDNGTVEETTVEENTTTNFSKPDSTGKQYPTSTTTNKKTIHRGEQKNLNSNVENKSNIDYLTRNEDKSNFKFDASIKDKSKSDVSQKTSDQLTEETETPVWIYVVGIVLVFAFIIFIYTVLKRNGVIK
jgi:cobalamin biosynthesis Mg chelatase CobN